MFARVTLPLLAAFCFFFASARKHRYASSDWDAIFDRRYLVVDA